MSDNQIKASRCEKCQKVVVPPRELCPYCRNTKQACKVIQLNNKGTVLSFTELHSAPEGFQAPLLLALIELEYGAVILSLAADDVTSNPAIGTSVKLSYDDEARLRFHLTN
jgi:uncharacterized OB-fold protein